MVKKYIILAYSNDKTFNIPRQMVEINGEPLLKRTIRLLRENGIEDITVTGNNEKYKELGVKLYSSKNNDFDYVKRTGYWLNAFDFELMDEPVCFIWGDVYFSDEAIKTIVETDTDSTMFFCSYNNNSRCYIKEHDEPFAYKVVDTDLFKEHITKVKKMKDDGLCCREPIVWELYRSIHGQDINTHQMTTDYTVINDITCDIDSQKDLDKIKMKIGGGKIKLSIIIPYYKTYELTDKLLKTLIPQLTEEVEAILIDDGCNETRLDEYKDKINIIHLEENKGGAAASNAGLRKANGQYIGFIDSDDMVDKNYIKELTKAIDERDEDAIFMDWQDMANGVIMHRPDNYAPWKAIYKKEITPMFKEGRIYSYDVPFYEELNSKPYTKYYIDKVLYYYNSSRPDNLTHKKAQIIEEEKRKNMIKVEVIEKFTYAKYEEIKDTLKRKSLDEKGMLFVGDTFECDKETVEYLTGGNPIGKVVVKVIEVEPEKVIPLTDNEEPEVFIGYSQVIEEQPKKKTTRKKK